MEFLAFSSSSNSSLGAFIFFLLLFIISSLPPSSLSPPILFKVAIEEAEEEEEHYSTLLAVCLVHTTKSLFISLSCLSSWNVHRSLTTLWLNSRRRSKERNERLCKDSSHVVTYTEEKSTFKVLLLLLSRRTQYQTNSNERTAGYDCDVKKKENLRQTTTTAPAKNPNIHHRTANCIDIKYKRANECTHTNAIKDDVVVRTNRWRREACTPTQSLLLIAIALN